MRETADLQSAIDALWEDARPRLLARVEVLEAALAGPFGAGERERAQSEAHTLAGTLGAFGRGAGSQAARAAERAVADGDREALGVAVRELREAVAAKPAGRFSGRWR